MKTKKKTAVIAGGGMGGLLSAFALAQNGWKVNLCAWGAIKTGGFLTLWPNALWVLDQFGLLKKTLEAGYVKTSSEIKNRSGRVLARVPLGRMEEATGYPVLNIARDRLAGLLQKQGAGLQISTGKVTGYEICPEDKKVQIFLEGGETQTADLLVGADGFDSVVRRQMIGPEKTRYAGRFSFNGVASGSSALVQKLIPEMFYEMQGAGMRAGYALLPRERIGWYANMNLPEDFEVPEDKLSFLLNRYKKWPVVLSLFRATNEDDIDCYKIQDKDPVFQWTSGPVALLGDAAHPMTPDAGQGVCQAMEDAYVLARELHLARLLGRSVDEALVSYGRCRSERAASVVLYARKLGYISNWSSPPAVFLRETVLRMLSCEKMIQPFIDLVRSPGLLE